MCEHAFGYTVAAALDLARSLKHGPLPAKTDPVPSPEEAIRIIEEERHSCGFNWITGEVAEAVLRAYAAGRHADSKAENPYLDWSDEYRAWTEGRK